MHEVDGKRMSEGREVVGRKGEKKPWSWARKQERERLGEVRERTVSRTKEEERRRKIEIKSGKMKTREVEKEG